jgi:C4-dicarboxylate-specific signal transduction histidine kinase
MAAALSHEITQPIASARNNARAAQNFLDMQPQDLNEVREALSCVRPAESYRILPSVDIA